MDVHVAGDDPVRAAVVAALEDVDVGIRDAGPSDLETARFGIVAGVAGAETFRRAADAARAGGTPWIGVEIGGVGGRPIADLDAAVTGFAPSTACFDCLRARVASTVDEDAVADSPAADRSAARFAGAVAGRECVRALSGDDRDRTVLGAVREVPYARRNLFPVPGCDCADGGPDRALDTAADDSLPLEAALDRAELAVDERVGLVTSIGEVDSFPAPYYLATAADTSAYSDASAPTNAAGVDDDWNGALMKALGESLERYCAAVYRDDEFVRASYEALDAAVPPTDLVRPDDAPAFDPTAAYRWVAAANLRTEDATHLPAAAVHFPSPGERLVSAITTGLGLGSSPVDAVLSGLTEVVERDATMLAWYSTYEPLGLDVDDETYGALARRARSEGLSVRTLLVTQDVDVPVVAAAVYRDGDAADGIGADATDGNDDGWPRFAVGSAAGLDATAAARSSLAEALQNWMELRSLGPEAARDESGAIGEYGAFPGAARSFVDVDGTIPADSVGPDPPPTGSAALEALVSRLEDAGLTPYAARLTTRDVADLGFEAVRVVVPGAQPLVTGSDETYFGERARTVPAALGFEPRLDRRFHPYP